MTKKPRTLRDDIANMRTTNWQRTGWRAGLLLADDTVLWGECIRWEPFPAQTPWERAFGEQLNQAGERMPVFRTDDGREIPGTRCVWSTERGLRRWLERRAAS